MKKLLTLMVAAFLGCPLFATTWYVNGTSGSDSYSGASSTQAKKTIQAAIDASVAGDTIRVAAGTYSKICTDNKVVRIISESGAERTVIQGDGEEFAADLHAEPAPYTNTVLKGFSVVNGRGGVLGGTVENSIIQDNDGIGLSHGVGINCLIRNNRGYNGGGCQGAICFNCTIVGNTLSGGMGSGTYSCSLYNCIVYNNEMFSLSPSYDANEWWGKLGYQRAVNVCSEDPHFVDSDNGDYRLAVGSPCINAGDNLYVTSETDLDGNARIVGGKVDIGCYEYQGGRVSSQYTVTFNANGGSCSTSSKQYASGTTLGTLPTATRSGYTFDGWYTSSSGGTKVSSSTAVTKAITYYAHWTQIPAKPRLEIYDDHGFWVEKGDEIDQDSVCFVIESDLSAEIKVTGLPSGIGYRVSDEPYEGINHQYLVYLTGKVRQKGIHQITCTAKDAKGNVLKDTVTLALWLDETYCVGFDVGDEGACSECVRWVEPGHAMGTLPTATRSGYTLEGWYTSSSGGTKVTSAMKVNGDLELYAHWKEGSGKSDPALDKVYVGVAVDRDCVGMGTVSGGNKLFKGGAKVSLSAKAAKGYVFAGWIECGEPLKTVSGDFRKASDSFVVEQETEICAYFVPKSDDAEVGIEITDEWVVEKNGYDGNYAVCDFWVDSWSLPTVTVKGLPSGCKYDKANSRLVFAKQPSKPGVSKVTISVKNASGAKAERVIYVKVPNLRSDVFEYLDYDSDYHVTCGVSDACFEMCDFAVKPGWTVKASGLPSGLKFDASQMRLYGTPTKAGTYTITFTATKKGFDAQKATITFVVDPLPNEAVGKFNGVVNFGGECIGSFTMTATAAGKLSATLVTADGKKRSYSAKSWNCEYDGIYVADFYKAAAKGACAEDGEWVHVELDTNVGWDDWQLRGEFLADPCWWCGSGEIIAQRNPYGKVGKNYENWDAHSIVATLAGFGKMDAIANYYSYNDVYDLACPFCVEEPTKPDLTFTVDVNGGVKVAGKIAGKRVSGSSTLLIIDGEPQADFLLLVGKVPVSIHVGFYLEYGAGGAIYGMAWDGWWGESRPISY